MSNRTATRLIIFHKEIFRLGGNRRRTDEFIPILFFQKSTFYWRIVSEGRFFALVERDGRTFEGVAMTIGGNWSYHSDLNRADSLKRLSALFLPKAEPRTARPGPLVMSTDFFFRLSRQNNADVNTRCLPQRADLRIIRAVGGGYFSCCL